MRIMAIADEECAYLWDHFDKSKLEGVDLIISCGDLHPHYLSFLATFTSAPVLYVHGNHDEKYDQVPPDGSDSVVRDGRHPAGRCDRFRDPALHGHRLHVR